MNIEVSPGAVRKGDKILSIANGSTKQLLPTMAIKYRFLGSGEFTHIAFTHDLFELVVPGNVLICVDRKHRDEELADLIRHKRFAEFPGNVLTDWDSIDSLHREAWLRIAKAARAFIEAES